MTAYAGVELDADPEIANKAAKYAIMVSPDLWHTWEPDYAHMFGARLRQAKKAQAARNAVHSQSPLPTE